MIIRLDHGTGALPPSGAHSGILHPELVWAALAAAGLVGSG